MNVNIGRFERLGVDLIKRQKGKDTQGTCPFCGKKKFFINEKQGLWDCKVCGASGNYGSFLSQIQEHFYKKTTREAYEFLEEIKGISTRTLKKFQISLNSKTAEYLVPYVSSKGTISNLKRFDPSTNRLMASAGTHLEVFGAWLIPRAYTTIWLTEGEWDAMVLDEVLFKLNRLGSEVSLALPGATQWKENWEYLFHQKKVVVCFDNDDAGRRGVEKLYNKLKNKCSSLLFLEWPASTTDKYDVRDHYLKLGKDAKQFMSFLESKLTEKPTFVNNELPTKYYSPTPEFDGSFIHPKDVKSSYAKWLLLEDLDIIDILYGTVIANRLEGDPLWLFMIASSGGGKSELLMSLFKAPDIYSTTTLTATSLISGMPTSGGDPSLIPKLDQKVLVIKDFTTILTMPSMERDNIFGILRDAYDGQIEKNFGNGLVRSYESSFGIIAGTTPVIEHATGEYVALGERFLRWKMPDPNVDDRKELLRRVAQNSGVEDEMRKELLDIGRKVLAYDYPKRIELSIDDVEQVIDIAELISHLRGAIIRDTYTKQVVQLPLKELATRLTKQLVKLGKGLALFYGLKHFNQHILRLVTKTGWYTVDTKRTNLITMLVLNDEGLTIREVEKFLQLSKQEVYKVVEDLALLEIVTRRKIPGGNKYMIFLTNSISGLLKRTGIVDLILTKDL